MIEIIAGFFLTAHLAAAAAVYFILSRKSRQKAFCMGAIVLFIPIGGLIYYCAEVLLSRRFTQKNFINVYDYSLQRSEDTDRNMNFIDYDEDAIPIQDVIAINGISNKREILINTIRQNLLTDYNTLLTAMHDDDREVSHYAVSVITNTVDRMENEIFKLNKTIYDDDGAISASPDVLKKYEKILANYIKVCSMDEITEKNLLEKYDTVLSNILERAQESLYFEKAVALKMKQNDLSKAEYFCQWYERAYPLSERPYILLIKLYASKRDREQLESSIKKMKALPSVISSDALGLIRYWDTGDSANV
ncbi:hypothetical protein [Pectinatus haikarae]|uniref:Uncharacterized protein n=1 Tax=Pectinatus haikarae TaxID=349096 RepID=A0ABT9Y4Z1_9FIRM|nr:hypothetical protein [Pectinatus haikarae]MDQ0202898.1 hypothetical protein [Pectinatus haikarae]